jgi:hypothetical protein
MQRVYLDGLDDIAPVERVLGTHTPSTVHELGAQLEESLVLLGEPLGPLRGILQGEYGSQPDEEAENAFNHIDVSPSAES